MRHNKNLGGDSYWQLPSDNASGVTSPAPKHSFLDDKDGLDAAWEGMRASCEEDLTMNQEMRDRIAGEVAKFYMRHTVSSENQQPAQNVVNPNER
jgi:hypothetical protein